MKLKRLFFVKINKIEWKIGVKGQVSKNTHQFSQIAGARFELYIF